MSGNNDINIRDDINIRRANANDAEPLACMSAQTFYDTFVNSCRPEDMEAYLSATFTVAQQSAELVDPRSSFFIAEVGGVMVEP